MFVAKIRLKKICVGCVAILAMTAWADEQHDNVHADNVHVNSVRVAKKSLASKQQPGKVAAPAKKPATDALPLDDLRTFTQVYDQIRNAYVEPVDDQTLLSNAIIGMLTQLDPHSAYLDKNSFEDLQETTSGEFGGLGIEVSTEDGFVKVVSPIDDTPAQRAGIKAGDLIIKLDDTPVKGMTLDQAINRMRGLKGTKIDLTIMRQGVDKPLEFTLVRDVIKVVSVRTTTLEPGFVYVRIAQFQVNTADELRKSIEKLQKENSDPLKGIVLDLRNNPGGVLQGAVDVSDIFLDKGLIVSTRGRVPNANMQFEATPGDLVNGAPVVVLINDGTASAAEIVAGALQDQDRAIVVGTQSFGKGSVQTVIPLSQDRAIKLTTARYYTPSGRSIQAQGIVPDIVVEPAVIEALPADAGHITEANLAGHLENDTAGGDKSATRKKIVSADKQVPGQDQQSWHQDNQLEAAFNVLKAVSISRQPKQVIEAKMPAGGMTDGTPAE